MSAAISVAWSRSIDDVATMSKKKPTKPTQSPRAGELAMFTPLEEASMLRDYASDIVASGREIDRAIANDLARRVAYILSGLGHVETARVIHALGRSATDDVHADLKKWARSQRPVVRSRLIELFDLHAKTWHIIPVPKRVDSVIGGLTSWGILPAESVNAIRDRVQRRVDSDDRVDIDDVEAVYRAVFTAAGARFRNALSFLDQRARRA